MENKSSNDTGKSKGSIPTAVSPEVVSESIASDGTAKEPESRSTSAFSNSSLIYPTRRKTKPRDIEAITDEIHRYNLQFGEAAYDVGQLLIEAKGQLEHGQWLEWLRNRVDFSEATARRFIRIAKEYPNRSSVTDLGFSKAIALLELSQEERTAFIKECHIINRKEKSIAEMSCRELRKIIKDKISQKTAWPEPEDESKESSIPEPEASYYEDTFNPDNYIKNIRERIDGILDFINNRTDDPNTREGLSENLRILCEDTLRKIRRAELTETED